MPPEPFLTSAGWSLNGLITQGRRFREIPRISVSDKNLEATIRKHESSGVPLVIEGMHVHQVWPASMFDIQWLGGNLKQQIQVRNVHNRRDLDVSFAEFLEHIRSIPCHASADETSRWYAKDIECPHEWKEWLNATPLVPRSLHPHDTNDIMQNLPEQARVETLMCYLGIGDTFTPCHKDLCASFGHNLMCYAENGGSAFWFMTESSAAPLMAKYFQSLGQELDLESHTMSIEEFAAAPCDIYITEQKAGDLVLVPPRSCHQVVNHCGLTVKMSWSRMTIRSTQVALRYEIPIYRRVCRVETYRVKSTIHHTLRRKTCLLEDLGKGKDSGTSIHDIFRAELADDMQKLLELFWEVILEECYPDAEILDHVIQDFNHNVYESEGYPAFSCDFCGSDIFVSFFCCKPCSPLAKNTSNISDGLHICPGCYAEGRSCGCGALMEPVQCWPFQILYGDYNRAVRALKGVGVEIFDEVEDHAISDSKVTGVFEAGIAIQKWQTEVKGGSLCYAKAQPHAVQNSTTILHCKKCRKGHCFVHLAEAGIHSSEAVSLYKKSPDESTWHDFHLKKRTSASDKETMLAAEASGDDVSNLIGQKLAIIALSFSHCQPLNNIPRIKLGWYDRLKFTGVATLGSSDTMDMSFPRDGSDWGSSPTDICPEDSASNTVVGLETPPREPEPAKSRASGPATAQSSIAVVAGSMKRKRTSAVLDGVAPPGRRRKTNTRYSESPPSAAPPPRSATSVKSDEKSQGPQSTQSSTLVLESLPIQEISSMETLTTAIMALTREVGALRQENACLRDEFRQTVHSNKRDIQRLENRISKENTELGVKVEKMLEESENRVVGPVHRLLEERGSIRVHPPAPVHVPVNNAFSSTALYPLEPPAGNGEWTTPDDDAPAEPNKLHYQEDYEKHRQPNKHSGSRGSVRPHRGRGRGFRGAYPGNRPPNQRPNFPPRTEGWGNTWPTEGPSTSVPAPLEPALTQVLTPHSTSVPDSCHSQGYVLPPQSPHAPSHTYPHSFPSSSTHTRPHPRAYTHTDPPTSPTLAAAPSQPARHRQGAQSHVYEHERAHLPPRDRPQPPPPRLHELRGALTPAPRVTDDGHRQGAHPQVNEHGHARPRGYPQPPPPSRSHEWRPAPAPGPQAQAMDDGHRDADSYSVHSPEPSHEQVRWTSSPTSNSVGGLRRRHGQSQSRGSSPSRSYVGHSRHSDEVRGGRR